MGRRLRYQVAVTLDGFIAGSNGEADWILMDPSIDFGALVAEFDTLVMGRKTYEAMAAFGGPPAAAGTEIVVFSRTLPPKTGKNLRITNDEPAKTVAALKKKPGRDIWLFGGGSLCRTLLDAGLVDTVEVAVMPVLLGSGVPLLPAGAPVTLKLTDHTTLPATGTVVLAYSVSGSRAEGATIGYVKGATAPGARPTTPTRRRSGRAGRR